MDPKDIVYNYIEFFFSKKDLHSMMTIKPLSYEMFMKHLYDLYSLKPELKEDEFHYNIMHTDEYKSIIEKLKFIHKKSEKGEHLTNPVIKAEIDKKFLEIEELYKKLYYYDEIYVYAHYVFNNIRKITDLGIQRGGGRTLNLEQFKDKIREKIKLLDL